MNGFTDTRNLQTDQNCEYGVLEECPDYFFDLEQWEITERDDSYHIEHIHNADFTYELVWDAGGPNLSEVKDISVQHIAVVYLSGSVGTSSIINIYRGLIFDKDELKFVGDFPYRYEDQSDGSDKLAQPEWNLKEGILHIKDEIEGIDTQLEL